MRLLYKAILFDLDNTLLDTEQFYEEALLEVYKFLQKYLKIVPKEEFIRAYHEARDFTHNNLANTAASHSRILYLQYTFEILGIEFDSSLIYEANEIYWSYVVKHAKPYEFVEELLDILQNAGIRTCLVTDNKTEVQMFKLKESGLDKYINYIVSAEEVGRDKPGAAQFLFAINKMNILAKEALVIGNNPKTDIEGANNAGMDSCLFDPKSRFKDNSVKATYKIKYYRELVSILGLQKFKVQEKNLQKLFIVDGLGTTFKQTDLIKENLIPLLKSVGTEVPTKQVYRNYNLFSKGFLTEEEFIENLNIKRNLWTGSLRRDFLDSIQLNDKVVSDLCNKLSKNPNNILVILSNIPYQWGEYLWSKFELSEFFDRAFWAGRFGLEKPDVRLIYRIWEEFPNVGAKNIYILDDHLEALRIALGFDFKTVWIKRADQPIKFIPTAIVDVTSDISIMDTMNKLGLTI